MQEIVQEFVDLYKENDNDYDLDHPNLEIIENGDWVQDYKYQNKETIVKFKGIFISIQDSRSGSPFTDWHYGDSYIQQVERHEKVVTSVEWKGVGEQIEVDARW